MYKIEQRSPVDPRMMVVGIVPDPKVLALRTFECRKGDHSFASTVARSALYDGRLLQAADFDWRPLRLPSPSRAISEVKSSAGGVRWAKRTSSAIALTAKNEPGGTPKTSRMKRW